MEIVLIFFVLLTVLFLLFHFAPGDPVNRMVDPSMTHEDARYMISQLGLDKPLLTQYVIYLKNFLQGSLGNSFHYGEPVISIIADRLPNTVLLFTTSIVQSAFAGIFLGKISAWHKGERIDTIGTIIALVCHTLFLPWIALIVIWVFGYHIGLFPLGGGMLSPELWINPDTSWFMKAMDIGYHMVLPLFTLCIIHFGSYMLIMRSSMLDVIGEDYVMTAKAKGLSDKQICNRHIAPNASLPVVTSIGLSLAFSVNGGGH